MNPHNALKWLSALSLSLAFAACNDDVVPYEPSQSDCIENDVRTIECGENNAGTQAQICIDGDWDNDGECDIPADGCTDGDTQTIECTDNK